MFHRSTARNSNACHCAACDARHIATAALPASTFHIQLIFSEMLDKMQLSLFSALLVICLPYPQALALSIPFERRHIPSKNHRHPRSFVYLFSSSVDKAKLDIGQTPTTFHDLDSNSYESGLQALRAYHKLNGDLVIPRSFVVPDIEGRSILCFVTRCAVSFKVLVYKWNKMTNVSSLYTEIRFPTRMAWCQAC